MFIQVSQCSAVVTDLIVWIYPRYPSVPTLLVIISGSVRPAWSVKTYLLTSNRHHSKNLRNFYGTLNCWSCGSRGRNTKYRIVRSRVWQCLAGGSILISALVRMNGGLGVVQALCCSQHGWVRPQSYCLSRDISAFQTFFWTEDSAASDKNIQSKDDSGQ